MTTPVVSAASSRHPWLLMPDPNLHTQLHRSGEPCAMPLQAPEGSKSQTLLPGTLACRRAT